MNRSHISHPRRAPSTELRSGFTLVELMIVIAIIAVLAAVATPQYKRAREESQRKACQENQRKIAGAIEQYNLDQNKSVTELTPDFTAKLVEQRYLLTDPVCPSMGNSAVYKIQGASGDKTSVACAHHDAAAAPAPPPK